MPVRKRLIAALIAPLFLLPGCAPAAPDSAAPRGANGSGVFRHPGVVVGGDGLAAVRQRVTEGREPWKSAFDAMRASRYASLAYAPHPVADVACPPEAGPPACLAEREDAIAAYTHALLWRLTGERRHAVEAVRIMDAWSAVLKRHSDGNAGLQAAWSGSTWARAADLVHATYPGWEPPAVERFKWMLRKAFLPAVTAPVADYNGNWELAMTDATIGIAVFLEDRAVFADALRRFRDRVPAYFYLTSDGPLPKTPPGSTLDTPEKIRTYWFGQRTYVDGLGQETCRNLMHIGYALAATAHIAETAWHQGVDLYAEQAERLRAALEFHARYQLGAQPPKWLCGGRIERTMGPDVEVALNHLGHRLHLALPETEKLAASRRPGGTDDLFVAWETLTHADGPGRADASGAA
ncbi:alginate lyase family protein [Streptomyces californicus]|uniref:alginate lyase family protein n=1 Tax=Streptomyces californicus TaxID=67351 RepID=UPI0036737195